MLKSLAFLGACSPALAALVQRNWDIGWVSASPDGFARPVIGINGQWPLPLLEATVGDTVRVTINNKLGNETTGIHWHGLHQIETNEMDGPAGGTQCPVPPGKSFTYEFVVDHPGTYWYHSHAGGQYPDGLRGPLVVKHGKAYPDPYEGKYEKEYLLTLSDWYHAEVPTLLETVVFNKSNVQARPPTPAAGLINDGAGATYDVQPGKKYKFRIINMSALTGVILNFGDNKVEIIEADGIDIKATDVEQLYVTPAQRYSIIVTAKDTKAKNMAITGVFDLNPNFRATPPLVGFPMNVTAQLRYDASLPAAPQVLVSGFSKLLNDVTLRPAKQVSLGKTDIKLTLDFNIAPDSTGQPRATINGKPYIQQKVPTLYSVLSAGKEASNPVIYGEVNPSIVKKGQVVEIVLNNLHPAHHPFHLHGHHFQVCSRAAPQSGKAGDVVCQDDVLVRDVVNVEGGSSAIIRFKADNPGVWLLHCHIEWHVPMGLSATIIEDVEGIQSRISVPKEHFELCAAQCLPWKGNAGGNTVNFTDLSNANNVPVDGEHSAIFKAKDTCPADPPSSSTTKKPTGSATGYPTGTASPSVSLSTSTLYSTKTYTVTSCKPTVTNCHAGAVTTEVIPYTTTVCPVTITPTVTYVKPTGKYDDKDDADWKPVPGSSWAPATTLAYAPTPAYPTGGSVGTVKASPSSTGTGKAVVTAGAAVKAASGFGALAVAGVVAALL